MTTAVHTHPASDECVVQWDGVAQAWAQGAWHDMEVFDVVLAPCGVEHGIAMVPGAIHVDEIAAVYRDDPHGTGPARDFRRPSATFRVADAGR